RSPGCKQPARRRARHREKIRKQNRNHLQPWVGGLDSGGIDGYGKRIAALQYQLWRRSKSETPTKGVRWPACREPKPRAAVRSGDGRYFRRLTTITIAAQAMRWPRPRPYARNMGSASRPYPPRCLRRYWVRTSRWALTRLSSGWRSKDRARRRSRPTERSSSSVRTASCIGSKAAMRSSLAYTIPPPLRSWYF